MKSVVLLTIALFLISAPAPDANDVAELTANFIVPTQEPGLQASQQEADRERLKQHFEKQNTPVTAPVDHEAESSRTTLARDSEHENYDAENEPPFET